MFIKIIERVADHEFHSNDYKSCTRTDFILRLVNMLYIDQPVQTGFSYDYPTNVTSDLTSFLDGLKAADFSDGVPQQNHSFLVGTLSSQNPVFTLNSTENAARATWHFAQTFFAEFPHYKPKNDKVSIWTES